MAVSSNAQDIFQTVKNKYAQYKNSAPKERVLIFNDRDIYAPGEQVWLNASIFSIVSTNISTLSSELAVTLLDSEMSDIFSKHFEITAGHADGFMKLPENLPEGVYYLKGVTSSSDGNENYLRRILVKKYILPPFEINVSFPDKDYRAGDIISVSLLFKNFFSEPLKNAEYSMTFRDGSKSFFETSGKLKKESKIKLDVKIPEKISDGLITYKITARVKANESMLEGILKVISNDIYMDFFPEGGGLIPGIANTVSLFAYNGFGQPVSVSADLIQNGKLISEIQTDSLGMGKFRILPEMDQNSFIKISQANSLEKKFELPEPQTKGCALLLGRESASGVTFNIKNLDAVKKNLLLIGVSNGEIFSESRIELTDSTSVKINFEKATGALAHFVLVDEALKINGERILPIPDKESRVIRIDPAPPSVSKQRAKVDAKYALPSGGGGRLVFKAVNKPWIFDQLKNPRPETVALPFDFFNQFFLNDFSREQLNFEKLRLLTNYYIPYNFGWDRILNTKGAFALQVKNKSVASKAEVLDQFAGKNRLQKSAEVITQSNLLSTNYFAMTNQLYIIAQRPKKEARTPVYKSMLEDGTPILDVIQVIKNYNLEGNNIVFLGSSNSFNFQGGALIVIDGINRGTDATLLRNISPFDVEKIFVSTNANDIQRYTGLNSVGLIEISLKKGIEEETASALADEDSEFDSVDYEKGGNGQSEDYRSTLLWKTQTLDIGNNDVEFRYYNSDLISEVVGILYFIPPSGSVLQAEFNYTIK